MRSSFLQFLKNFFKRKSSQVEPDFLLPDATKILRQAYAHSQEIEGPGGAITAKEAYLLAREVIEKFDDRARLTGIESLFALLSNGQANGWKFVFSLPERWGYATFIFKIGPPDSLTVELSPFIGIGSGMAKMMDEGQVGFVEQQWKVEVERNRQLRSDFVDSPDVVRAFLESGKGALPVGVILKASTPPLGKSRWDFFDPADLKKSLYSYSIE